MKGFQFTTPSVLLITVGLFALQTQLVSSAFTMEQTCAYVTTGWIADPTSCQAWGYCQNGALKGTGKCNEGLLFDTQTGNCNTNTSVTCATTVQDICDNLSSPQLIADPNDCNKYCMCDGQGAVDCGKCPQYQFYNPTTKSCVWSSSYDCPADSICRLVPNNRFAGDPAKCGNFMFCLNGAGTSKPCPVTGEMYNAITGYCETSNPCDDDSDDGPTVVAAGPGVFEDLPSDPAVCASYTGTDGAAQFFNDGKSCMGHIMCNSVTGPGTWSKCPLGTHFDSVSQQCVTPFTVKCDLDRCGNLNQTFVTSVSSTDTSCNNYLYCIDQTSQPQSAGACPSNAPYFNEQTGYCSTTLPDFTICGGTA